MNINKTVLIVLFIQLPFQVNAQYQTVTTEKGTGYYLNPVFAGGPTPHKGPVPSEQSLKVLDEYFMWRLTPEGEAWAK